MTPGIRPYARCHILSKPLEGGAREIGGARRLNPQFVAFLQVCRTYSQHNTKIQASPHLRHPTKTFRPFSFSTFPGSSPNTVRGTKRPCVRLGSPKRPWRQGVVHQTRRRAAATELSFKVDVAADFAHGLTRTRSHILEFITPLLVILLRIVRLFS